MRLLGCRCRTLPTLCDLRECKYIYLQYIWVNSPGSFKCTCASTIPGINMRGEWSTYELASGKLISGTTLAKTSVIFPDSGEITIVPGVTRPLITHLDDTSTMLSPWTEVAAEERLDRIPEDCSDVASEVPMEVPRYALSGDSSGGDCMVAVESDGLSVR